MDMPMMNAWFTLSRQTTVLFEHWDVYRTSEWVLCCFAILGLSLCRESLSLYRVHRARQLAHAVRIKRAEYRKANAKKPASSYTHVFHPASFQLSEPLLEKTDASPGSAPAPYPSATAFEIVMTQTVDSFYYLLSLCFGYLLMLIIMSYNVGLCVIVVLSCFVSHLLLHLLYARFVAAAGAAGSDVEMINGVDISTLSPTAGDHCCPEIVV